MHKLVTTIKADESKDMEDAQERSIPLNDGGIPPSFAYGHLEHQNATAMHVGLFGTPKQPLKKNLI